MTALLIAPMASSLIQPMASWLINTITGKGAKCRFLSLLAFPFLMKILGRGVTRSGNGVRRVGRGYNKWIKVFISAPSFKQYRDYQAFQLRTYNQSQKLLRLTIFSWKSPKIMLELLQETQIFPSPIDLMLRQVWRSYAGQ